nr:RecName: Full=Hemocyanin subunit 4 [Homarus americanus]
GAYGQGQNIGQLFVNILIFLFY